MKRKRQLVEGCRIKTWCGLTGLDEMLEDFSHLLGVCDDGEYTHLRMTFGALERINFVDPGNEPGPSGSAFFAGDGAIKIFFSEGLFSIRMIKMFFFPTLRSEADNRWFVQPLAAH